MAGRVLFENGPHASRAGYRGEITAADMDALRTATPSYVSDEVLAGLANKIMFAEADKKRRDAYVPSRDQLAQLKKLKRIAKRDENTIDADGREHPFAGLADALANLDQGTLGLIQAADRAAIQVVIDDAGVFVDVDGDEHRFMPPATQVVRPFKAAAVVRTVIRVDEKRRPVFGDWSRAATPAGVWLPRGIDGFIESVSAAIAELEGQHDDAGRRAKPWQDALAKVVIEFWRTHCAGESQSAHRDREISDHGSRLVEFGRAVYGVAGCHLSAARISNLLNTCE